MYVVEACVPRSARRKLAQRGAMLERPRKLSREGTPVRYVRTTFLPGDEPCFHVFEAASVEAFAEVCRRAGTGSGRIVPAVE